MATITNNLLHQETTIEAYHKGLPVNTTDENPLFTSILVKIYNQITLVMARYPSVTIVRLDLHPANIINVDMPEFCRSFSRKLSKKSLSEKKGYNSKVAYGWVREIGRKDHNDGIHWHIWVALKKPRDLKPATHAKRVQGEILNSWEKYAGGQNSRNHRTCFFIIYRSKLAYDLRLSEQQAIADNPVDPKGVLISSKIINTRKNNRGEVLGGVIDECFYALSYLAKVFSKVPKVKNQRLFASSNLNTKDNRSGRQAEIEANLKEIHKNLSIKLSPMPVKQSGIIEC